MFSDKFSQKVLKKDSNKDAKKDFKKDAGDLIQTVLIVSGISTMCIVGLIPIGQSLANQAQEQNSCMSGSSNFISSNFGNGCDGDGSGGSQLVITPGISDPYPVVVPTPTPTPTPTPEPEPEPTPEPAEEVNIAPVNAFNKAMLTGDLKNFHSLAQKYAKENGGKYPTATASELEKLWFRVNLQYYPQDSPLSLEYCTVGDNDFVMSIYLGNNKVEYISSGENSFAGQNYTLTKTPKINESLCETSAREAGLTGKITGSTKGISVDNVPASWVGIKYM